MRDQLIRGYNSTPAHLKTNFNQTPNPQSSGLPPTSKKLGDIANRKFGNSRDCSTLGYVKVAVKVIEPDKRIAMHMIKKEVKKVVDAATTGCVVGGTIGGIGGAIAMPGAPVLGAAIAAPPGCKMGTDIAIVVHSVKSGIKKTIDVVETSIKVKDALQEHHKACQTPQ